MKANHATIKYTRHESKSGNCEEKLPTKIKSNIYERCKNCEKNISYKNLSKNENNNKKESIKS